MRRRQKATRIWPLVSAITALVAAVAVSTALYFHKDSPVEQRATTTITGLPLELSTASKHELGRYLQREELMVYISVVSVNLIQNELKIVFFQSKNDEINQLWKQYTANGIPVTQAFSFIPETNVHLANIINGDFDCILFKTSTTYSRAEELAPWVCSMTIPPGFHGSGDLVGFINLHLSRELTDAEKSKLAQEVASISVSIYTRDIIHGTKK